MKNGVACHLLIIFKNKHMFSQYSYISRRRFNVEGESDQSHTAQKYLFYCFPFLDKNQLSPQNTLNQNCHLQYSFFFFMNKRV